MRVKQRDPYKRQNLEITTPLNSYLPQQFKNNSSIKLHLEEDYKNNIKGNGINNGK
jgi:hypothetical protein